MESVLQRQQKSGVYFPDTEKVFTREINGSTSGNAKSMQQIATRYTNWLHAKDKLDKKSKISRSTVFNYLKGYRKPTSDFIEFFADTNYPGEPDRKGKLESEIRLTLENPNQFAGRHTNFSPALQVGYGGVLDGIRNGEKLRVMSVDYQPIAGPRNDKGEESFFESVVGRVLSLAQIPIEDVGQRRDLTPLDYNRVADLHYGIFNAPDRILSCDLQFWRLPIKMSLGALCWADDFETQIITGRILSGLDSIQGIRGDIRPIVVKNDIGAIYCRQVLKYSDGELDELKSMSLDSLVAQMEQRKGDVKPAFVCTDEFTSIELHNRLKPARTRLVFPLNNRRTGSEDLRRALPQYFCSIAANRSDVKFREFLDAILWQVLSTEVESTAKDLVILAKSLALTVAESLRISNNSGEDTEGAEAKKSAETAENSATLLAWEWVFYTLCLDMGSIETFSNPGDLPWKPILSRTREIIHSYFVTSGYLEKWVNALCEGTNLFDPKKASTRAPRSRELLLMFCRALDIPVNPEDITIPKSYLLPLLMRKLKPDAPIELEFEAHDINSKDQEAIQAKRAMRGFMRLLQNTYDELSVANLNAPDAVRKLSTWIDYLDDDIRNPRPQPAQGQTSIRLPAKMLVAKLRIKSRGPESAGYLGGTILQNLTPGDECELRYLWVNRRDRERGIGRRIVDKAIEVAKQNGCTSIGVQIFASDLHNPVKMFTNMGFKEQLESIEDGRTLYRKDLKRTTGGESRP